MGHLEHLSCRKFCLIGPHPISCLQMATWTLHEMVLGCDCKKKGSHASTSTIHVHSEITLPGPALACFTGLGRAILSWKNETRVKFNKQMAFLEEKVPLASWGNGFGDRRLLCAEKGTDLRKYSCFLSSLCRTVLKPESIQDISLFGYIDLLPCVCNMYTYIIYQLNPIETHKHILSQCV